MAIEKLKSRLSHGVGSHKFYRALADILKISKVHVATIDVTGTANLVRKAVIQAIRDYHRDPAKAAKYVKEYKSDFHIDGFELAILRLIDRFNINGRIFGNTTGRYKRRSSSAAFNGVYRDTLAGGPGKATFVIPVSSHHYPAVDYMAFLSGFRNFAYSFWHLSKMNIMQDQRFGKVSHASREMQGTGINRPYKPGARGDKEFAVGVHDPITVPVAWIELEGFQIQSRISATVKEIDGVTYSGSCLSLSSALSSYSNIPVIWDCAHSAGARHKEESVPTIACWSFHSVKNLSCGDGGMLTTKDVDIANRARALRWMGIDKSTWERTGDKYSWDYNCKEIGIKGHMNDVTAAIGRVQLSKLSVMQSKRHSIANMYTHELEDVVQCPYLPYDHGLHLYVIRVDEDKRNALVKGLNERGVQAGVHYRTLHFYSCYEGPIQPQLPVVEREWKRIVSLPLHSCMTLEDADIVCDAVKEVLA